MGHVIALGVELPCPVHGFLQDAQKLWSDLFPARHGRFDGGSCKFSGSPFKLMQDFGCFHWRFVRAEFSLHSPTVMDSTVCQNIFSRCHRNTVGLSMRGSEKFGAVTCAGLMLAIPSTR